MCARKKYMAVLVAAVLAAAGCALEAQHAAKSGDAPKETRSAYERQDPAELAETLSTMHMTEALQGMAAQHAGKDTVMDLWAYANAKLNLAAAEPDPAVARRLIDDAVAALGKLVDRTSKGASDEEVVSNMEYRLALVDACGRTACRLRAETILMLMGGEDDRQAILEYTGKVLTSKPDKDGNSTLSKADELEKMLGNVKITDEINYQVRLERLKIRVPYSIAWMKLYRGMVLGRQPGGAILAAPGRQERRRKVRHRQRRGRR